MSRFRYYMPLDPECPGVIELRAQCSDDDPMNSMCGCMDEIIEMLETRHRASCERCRQYGCAEIEVRS